MRDCHILNRRFYMAAKPQNVYILTYVRVALATLDVQSTLEIPATDEIHMEDRNHDLS